MWLWFAYYLHMIMVCILFTYDYGLHIVLQHQTILNLTVQRRSQHKNLVGKKFVGTKMCDYRWIALFCLEKRFPKHKITIISKHLGDMASMTSPGYACVTVPPNVCIFCRWIVTNSAGYADAKSCVRRSLKKTNAIKNDNTCNVFKTVKIQPITKW